jgi:hypothetical protein
VRAHLLLALSILAASPLARGATFEGAAPLRASLDDAVSAPEQLRPRMIRKSLDDAYAPSTVSVASFPADDSPPQVLPPPPRRVFRVSLDHDQPAFDGRLIRLSLEEGRAIYGRLSASQAQGRHLRTSLD